MCSSNFCVQLQLTATGITFINVITQKTRKQISSSDILENFNIASTLHRFERCNTDPANRKPYPRFQQYLFLMYYITTKRAWQTETVFIARQHTATLTRNGDIGILSVCSSVRNVLVLDENGLIIL